MKNVIKPFFGHVRIVDGRFVHGSPMDRRKRKLLNLCVYTDTDNTRIRIWKRWRDDDNFISVRWFIV